MEKFESPSTVLASVGHFKALVLVIFSLNKATPIKVDLFKALVVGELANVGLFKATVELVIQITAFMLVQGCFIFNFI